MNYLRMKLLIFGFIFLVSATLPAQSQQVVYVCPEGTIYSATFGYVECVPIWEKARSKTDSMLSSAMAQSVMLEGISKEYERLTKDPRRKSYAEGEWTFTGDKPNEPCSAMYYRKGVWTSIIQPGGNVVGAFLMFWSLDIPRPKEISQIRATLEQDGEKPQTVKVINMTIDLNAKEKISIGTIFFQILTVEAAINGIKDVQKFGASIKGKSIAQMEWKDGIAARDKLKQCVERKKVKKS